MLKSVLESQPATSFSQKSSSSVVMDLFSIATLFQKQKCQVVNVVLVEAGGGGGVRAFTASSTRRSRNIFDANRVFSSFKTDESKQLLISL